MGRGKERLELVFYYSTSNKAGGSGFGREEGLERIFSYLMYFPVLLGWSVPSECLLVLEAGIMV